MKEEKKKKDKKKKKLEKALKKARKQKEILQKEEPIKRQFNPMIKAKNNPTSKALAIKACCFHCMGGTIEDMPDGGWRNAIYNCTSPDCPLYPVRPKRKLKNEEEDNS